MVIQTTYTQTDSISYVFTPSSLHFCSESAIRYIRFRIRIRSLSAPLRIRWKNMVEKMVKVKSDPIHLHPYPHRIDLLAVRAYVPRLVQSRSPLK
jgi:hypothetical protein